MPDYDFQNLSTEKLLGLTLKTETVHELLAHYNTLHDIYQCTPEELSKNVKGLSINKAVQLQSVLEIGRRFFMTPITEKPLIKTPQDAVKVLSPSLCYKDREIFYGVYLNTKNRVLAIEKISIGGLNSSMAHPREIFKPALRLSANSLLVAHNHPSTDPMPSSEDIAITARIADSGRILGIQLVDHIIIASPNNYVSLKELGHL